MLILGTYLIIHVHMHVNTLTHLLDINIQYTNLMCRLPHIKISPSMLHLDIFISEYPHLRSMVSSCQLS